VNQKSPPNQIPLKMLHSHYPPDPETRISRYKFKFNQHLNLSLYREILRNLSFSIWWILGVMHFQWNLSYREGVAKTHMTDSTENASPPLSTRSRNSNFSVQIQIKPTSQSEFVLRDTANLSRSIWWILGVMHFQWNLSYRGWRRLI